MKPPMKECPLTALEQRIVDMSGAGYEPKTIADKLFRSPSTIATHITRIRIKLGLEHGNSETLRVFLIARNRVQDVVYEAICRG